MTLSVCLCGAAGHVGRELVQAIEADDDLKLTAAVGASTAGQRLDRILPFQCPSITIQDSVEKAWRPGAFSVLIDYTTPDAVYQNVVTAITRRVHCVIGTSGLSDAQYEALDSLARAKGVGLVAAGNFSITATLMQHFAVLAARHVPNWEIIDYAPETKKDAPSGTARELAFQLSKIGRAPYAVAPEAVQGLIQSRGAALNGSQMHAVRVPGFYSSAEIILGLPGERLSLRHDSMSYQPYVAGTLLAARKVHTFVGLRRGLASIIDLQPAAKE